MWSYLMWFTALTIKLYLHRWVGFQFPINASHEQRQTSHLIYTFRFWQEKWGFVRDLFLLQLLGRHYLIMHCMHCSSCCQLTGIKKINRTATVAGVHSFLLGWWIYWGRIIREGEFVIVLLWWGWGERLLVNYAENMRSQSGFRISEFQHWIGGTKPWQSLTRRAKFDEMWHVALDLDPSSFRGWKMTSDQ